VNKAYQTILLAAVPGLMFCIIPAGGMPFRLSWQLVAIWIACGAVVVMLSSWWWRLFLLLALLRTATRIPPAYDEYISLLMIAMFLACAEGFSRIDREKTMDFMCIAVLIILDWMSLQRLGIAHLYFGVPGGLFNPDTAAIFLALCLPGCFRKWSFRFESVFAYRLLALAPWRREWRYMLVPLIFGGLYMAWSTTGFLAALAAMSVYIWLSVTDRRNIRMGMYAVLLLAGVWFWQVKPLDLMTDNSRWITWKHAAWSLRSEAFGRGLGSWEWVFPLLASGDPRLGKVTYENGVLLAQDVFAQAHNEYIQTPFEMGVQSLALILAFLATVFIVIYRKAVHPLEAMGMTALIVSCFGFFCMHVPPTALLGCAWLGLWHRNRQNQGTFEREGALMSEVTQGTGDRRSWAI
jgi:hypothetical protein